MNEFCKISLTSILLSTCASGPAKTDVKPGLPNPSAEQPSVAAKSSACFHGEGTITLPTGQDVGRTEALVRRTLNPEQSTITEEVVTLNPQLQRFVVTMQVDGSTFSMSESSGAFSGTGELVGEPWKWTAWSSRSELPNGMVVFSIDTVTEAGLAVKKKVTDGDGKPVVSIRETLQAIDARDCKERFDAIPAQL